MFDVQAEFRLSGKEILPHKTEITFLRSTPSEILEPCPDIRGKNEKMYDVRISEHISCHRLVGLFSGTSDFNHDLQLVLQHDKHRENWNGDTWVMIFTTLHLFSFVRWIYLTPIFTTSVVNPRSTNTTNTRTLEQAQHHTSHYNLPSMACVERTRAQHPEIAKAFINLVQVSGITR